MNDIFKFYEQAFEYIEMSGPCKLAPAIISTTNWVKNIAATESMFYAVLLIVTDGEVTDMDATISAIVDASYQPLSILIIGVGSKKFDDLSVLDGDHQIPRDKQGRVPARDIVQFVEYNRVASGGVTAFNDALLAELPAQIVEYFRIKNIKPVGMA